MMGEIWGLGLKRYDFVFVDEESFEKHAPKTFAAAGDTTVGSRP